MLATALAHLQPVGATCHRRHSVLLCRPAWGKLHGAALIRALRTLLPLSGGSCGLGRRYISQPNEYFSNGFEKLISESANLQTRK